MKSFAGRRRRLLGSMAALLLVVAACSSDEPAAPVAPAPPVEAEEPEEVVLEHGFEDGDIIRLVLGTNPGGGFDTTTMLIEGPLQEELRRLTGKRITVQREFLPGGGHLVALQQVQRADPDGLTVQYIAVDTAVSHMVVNGEDLQFEDWSHLGGVNQVGRGLLARASLVEEVGGELTFAALAEYSKTRSILIAHTGGKEDTELMFAVMADQGLPINVDFVQFDGTGTMATGLLRGDVDLAVANTAAFVPSVEDNPDDLVFMVHMGCTRSPDPALADVPSILEENPPGAREACELFQSSTRILTAPPGLSPGTYAVLTEALRNVVTDAAFAEDFVARSGTDAAWLEPEAVVRVVVGLGAAYRQYIDLLS